MQVASSSTPLPTSRYAPNTGRCQFSLQSLRQWCSSRMCTTTVPSRQSSSGLVHRDVEAMMQGLPSATEGKQRGPRSIHIRCEPSRHPPSGPAPRLALAKATTPVKLTPTVTRQLSHFQAGSNKHLHNFITA